MKTMDKKSMIFALLILSLAGSSCIKEKLETTYNSQETKIDDYIRKNMYKKVKYDKIASIDTTMHTDSIFRYDTTFTDEDMVIDTILVRIDTTFTMDTTKVPAERIDTLRVVYRNGSNRLVRVEGKGEELGENGNVSLFYAGYIFNGSVNASNLFVTNHKTTADEAGWELTDNQYAIYEINMHDTELIEGLRSGLTGVREGEECEILFSGKYGFGNRTFGMIPANSALLYKIWVIGVSND